MRLRHIQVLVGLQMLLMRMIMMISVMRLLPKMRMVVVLWLLLMFVLRAGHNIQCAAPSVCK